MAKLLRVLVAGVKGFPGMLDVVNLICWIEKLCVCTYVPKWPNHLKDLDLRMSGTLPPRGPTSNTMNRGDMIPKMLKTVQLNVPISAPRVHIADEAIAFHLFHRPLNCGVAG